MAKRHSSDSLESLALKESGYVLGDRIGEGSFSVVRLAEYTEKGEDDQTRRGKLACKVFKCKKATTDFLTNFFPRELDFLKRVKHPNIVETHSILQINSTFYIFMKYEANGDMLEFLRKYGPVDEVTARMWFSQMSCGLKYLHDQNIAHRDLKLENLLLTRKYNVRIADLGFARSCVNDQGVQVLSTTYCGSAAYAAPEIVSSVPYWPKRSDVWSLGIILFIMLNGMMPYDDANHKLLVRDQMQKAWRKSPYLKPELSTGVRALMGETMEPDHTRRITVDGILVHPWIVNHI